MCQCQTRHTNAVHIKFLHATMTDCMNVDKCEDQTENMAEIEWLKVSP